MGGKEGKEIWRVVHMLSFLPEAILADEVTRAAAMPTHSLTVLKPK